jgi:ATP-dependent DNA helicase RecQ
MDMTFTVTVPGTASDKSLKLDIMGMRLELSSLASGMRLAVSESSSGISVSVSDAGAEVPPSVEVGQSEVIQTLTSAPADRQAPPLAPAIEHDGQLSCPVSETAGSGKGIPVTAPVSPAVADSAPTVSVALVSPIVIDVASVVADAVPTAAGTDHQERLFQRLAVFRREIASAAKLPPYVIFHDSTLREMCRILPTDLEQLSSIQGVGKAKLEKYGAIFIDAISDYIAACSAA